MCAERMSSTRIITLLACLIGFSECFVLEDNSNKLHNDKWYCGSICGGSGGLAVLNTENKVCKCTLDELVDAVDYELMLKRALNLGLQIVTPDNGSSKLIKREASNAASEDGIVGQPKSKFTIPKSKPSITPSPFRSAQSNKRSPIVAPKKKALFPTPKKATTTRSSMDIVQNRLKELQNKLQDRMKSLTRNAPKLQQRAGFGEEKREHFQEQIKKLQAEIQEKMNARRTALSLSKIETRNNTPGKHANAVIGSQKKTNDKLAQEKSDSAIARNPPSTVNKHEIITQDPKLYMDEDDDDN